MSSGRIMPSWLRERRLNLANLLLLDADNHMAAIATLSRLFSTIGALGVVGSAPIKDDSYWPSTALLA